MKRKCTVEAIFLSLIRPAHCALGKEWARQLPLNLLSTLDKYESISSEPLFSSLFFCTFALLFALSLSHTHKDKEENPLTLGQVKAFIFMNRIRTDVTVLSSKVTEEVNKSLYVFTFLKFLKTITSL